MGWQTPDVPDSPGVRDSDRSKRTGRAVRPDAEPTVLIGPCAITYISVNHQTRLQFDDVEVVIESPFVLSADGVEHQLDPQDRSGLGPLLNVYPDDLLAAVTRRDCSLTLEFASGATIFVEQDPHYEAWQIDGPGSRLVVCPPAGDGTLSIWE